MTMMKTSMVCVRRLYTLDRSPISYLSTSIGYRKIVLYSTSSKQIHLLQGISKQKQRLHQRHVGLSVLAQRYLSSSSSSGNAKTRTMPSLWYPVLGGLLVTIAGGINYIRQELGGLEDLNRAATFYSFAIPTYTKYRYHMYLQSPDEVWNELDRKSSAEGLQKAYELEGFYVKSGQIVAANLGDAFPQIWQVRDVH
jgi:hypothetical protein